MAECAPIMRASNVVPERGAPIRKMRRSCISARLGAPGREAVGLDAQRAVEARAEVLERRLRRQLDDLALREVPPQLRELRLAHVAGRDGHHLGVGDRRALALREARVIRVAFDRLELVVRDTLSPAHGSIDVHSEDAADEGGDAQVDELAERGLDRPAARLEDGVHDGEPRHQARGVRRDRVGAEVAAEHAPHHPHAEARREAALRGGLESGHGQLLIHCSRSSVFCTCPVEAVRGSVSRKRTTRGFLKPARWARTCSTTSSSPRAAPGRQTTTAATISPQSGSGTPKTAASSVWPYMMKRFGLRKRSTTLRTWASVMTCVPLPSARSEDRSVRANSGSARMAV